MKMGTHTIPTILGICTLGTSFIAPTLWATNIKQDVAVQQSVISTIKENQNRFDLTLGSYDTRMSSMERKIDLLLYKNGINPRSSLTKN